MEDMISIIIPVYNTVFELSRCLDSVLNQTYTNIEVIAVDDGSTDGSGKILDRYLLLDDRVSVVHKVNEGVTIARLVGVKASHGEWVGFVDSDDVIEPDMYERLLKNAKTYSADISHCGYQLVFNDGRVNYFYNTRLVNTYNRLEGLRELLNGKIIEPGLCNKLFRSKLLAKLLSEQAMDLKIKVNEDLLMNYYLFSEAKRSVYEDWCPYHYLVRSNSVTQAPLDTHKIYDPIKVKDIIRKSIDNTLADEAEYAYINTCITVYNSIIGSGSAHDNHELNVRSKLINAKHSFYLLRYKRRLMVELITRFPSLYRAVFITVLPFYRNRYH